MMISHAKLMIVGAIAGTLIGGLTGCASPEEVAASQQAAVSQLPPGCSMKFLGHVKYSSSGSMPVVVVLCEGANVTTANMMVREGKVTNLKTTISIDETPEQIQAKLEAAKKAAKANAIAKLTPVERELLGIKNVQ